ncbi:DUF1905 domain-containing protein [Arthrobacter antioxidans]|uniref:DUF1905 domain-containing protein n=1 Tax=Arthrobacter antioxidans TaxID=2895818 RepID=UPI001FFFA3C8|nr:DUF1905 domain-containing protein [Arthrobacter antioxidans]
MSTILGPMDLRFTAPIGVEVKGDLWACVEVPDSKGLFGTGKAVRVAGSVDGEPFAVALMPTGKGGHMLSISARLRKKIGKGLGDDVVIHISERLT